MNLLGGIDLHKIVEKMTDACGECKGVCSEAGMFALRGAASTSRRTTRDGRRQGREADVDSNLAIKKRGSRPFGVNDILAYGPSRAAAHAILDPRQPEHDGIRDELPRLDELKDGSCAPEETGAAARSFSRASA